MHPDPFMEPMSRLVIFVSLAEADRLPATERSALTRPHWESKSWLVVVSDSGRHLLFSQLCGYGQISQISLPDLLAPG